MSISPILLEASVIEAAAPNFSSKIELAKHLGVGIVTLYKNLHRLGIKSLPMLPNPRNTGNQAWNKGFTKNDHPSVMSISLTHQGEKNARYGKKPWNKGLSKETNETLALISEKNSHAQHTEETKEKMSVSARVRKVHGMQGKHHSNETRKKLSESTLDQLSQGRVKQTRTKPHLVVKKLLDELLVSYREEVKVGLFSVDFMIGDSLIVEVNGDYWHSNPKFYPDGPKTKGQKINRMRDVKKMKTLADNNLEVVVVWEDEVNDGTHVDKIKQAIQRINSLRASAGTAEGTRP